MNVKTLRRWIRLIVPLSFFFWILPWATGIFFLFGVLDFIRHRRPDLEFASKYFAGNGFITWMFSPLNLFFDLISRRHHYRLEIDDLPEAEREEVKQMLKVFDERRQEIVADLTNRMGNERRIMLFYRWFGESRDSSIPEFNTDFRYIKTIGVSVFRGREQTRLHFGPLRLTLRLLYNLTPRQSDKIFIEVNGKKQFWHDNPMIIFDDTIQHRSVNDEDGLRVCAFVDILRPSGFVGLQNICVRLCNVIMAGANGIFYRNWQVISRTGR